MDFFCISAQKIVTLQANMEIVRIAREKSIES